MFGFEKFKSESIKKVCLVIFIIPFFILWIVPGLSIAAEIELTPEETVWIKKNPVIRVHNETDWPPFNFAKSGKPQGFSIDYMNLLAKKVGIEVQYVTGPSWNDFLEMIKRRELDVMLNIVKTPERLKYLLYTPPYANNPNTILSKRGNTYKNIEELSGKTVAVPKGFFYEEVLKRDYPQIKLLAVKNILESMKAVSFGKANAALGELAVFSYLLDEHLMTDLVISAELKSDNPELTLLNIATHKDLPILASILIKGVNSITRVEKQVLVKRWISNQNVQAPAADKSSNSIVFILTVSVVLLLVFSIVGFIFSRLTGGVDISAYFGSRGFRVSILAGLSLLVAVVVVMNWVAITDSHKRAVESIGEDLQIVLHSSIERLNIWVLQREAFLRQLGRDPEIVRITEELLSIGQERDALIQSKAMVDARNFFASNSQFGQAGFFIISPDRISIGSRRNTNIGTKNFIVGKRPDLIDRAFKGESVFVPPIRSDVHIDSDNSQDAKKTPLSMFFAVPISDENGVVLAVLTERIQPSGTLSKILQFGRVGKSGETYAFNDEGKMVSESRFKDQLVKLGLYDPRSKDLMELEIRNPGGNLTEGYQPNTRLSDRPLTHSVSSAFQLKRTKGKSEHLERDHRATDHAMKTEGYRDYRGVPVVGAWTWLHALNLGLATEIDEDEAMATHASFRFNLIVISAIALVLAICATLFTLILGQRAHSSLSKARDELEERVVERTEELKEREERLSSIIENATDGIITINTNAQIQSFSQAAEKMFGYSEDEVIGQNVKMLMPEPYQSEHDGYLQNYYSTGDAKIVGMNREVIGLRKDGSEFPMDLAVGESIVGELRWFTGIVRDITERKRGEAEISEKSAILEATLENMNQGIVMLDQDNRIVIWNRKFSEMRMLPEEFLEERPTLENIIRYQAEKNFYKELDGDVESQIKIRLEVGEIKEPLIYEQIRPGGIVQEIQSNPLSGGGMVRTYSDITERKKAEDAVKENEARLISILSSSPVGVGISVDGKVKFANDRLSEMIGYEPDGFIGVDANTFYADPKQRDHLVGLIEQEGFAKDVESILKKTDGTEFWVLNSAYTIEYGDESGLLIWSYDISERKAAEDAITNARDIAEEATKAKATFLATMSHEIRTPMGGVIGMVDLLQQTKLDDDQRHMTDTVRNSANSLLTIINDILDFSKIEAGKLDLEEVPISIRDAVEGVGEALAVNARNKNIGLSVFVDPNIPDAIIGDQVRVRQILFNLGGNAVKFTEKGKVLIRADLLPSEEEGNATIQFKIIDDGIGIPKDAQAKLFTAFSQVEASTTRKFGGTGLGLSICQRLTELMDGEIGVESEPGEGSVFHSTISFPIAEQHSMKSDGQDLGGLKVLLTIEDDDMRGLAPKYLEHWQAEVTAIPNIEGLENTALEAATGNNPFDVIGLISFQPLAEQIALVERLNGLGELPSKRFIIACFGRDRSERKAIDNTIYIDAGPLIRERLIRTIAIAAGRISPDVVYEEDDTAVRSKKAPSVEEAEAMGQLILFAEDNPTNQDVIGRQLTLLGYAYEMADDGQQALEMLQNKSYAILLTDCHMPNMDGFELTQETRGKEADDSEHLPIVAITASVMKEEIDACFAAGMDDYLPKPLEMPKLKDMLRKWMPEAESVTAEADQEPATRVAKAKTKSGETSDGGNGPIDPSALKAIFGDDDETFKEILKEFVGPSAANVEEIETSFTDRSAEGVAEAAHKLKSSARSVGANDLADLCQSLEAAGKTEDWNVIDKEAPRLSGTFEKVVEYINCL